VHVQVRDALADDVVHGGEDARRRHRRLHRAGEVLRALGERAEHGARRVHERHDVLARHEQDMPGEQRPDVEERDEVVVLEHHVGGQLAGDDPAEHAVRVHAATRCSGARPRMPAGSRSSSARRQ
jgi:hypothetical protein